LRGRVRTDKNEQVFYLAAQVEASPCNLTACHAKGITVLLLLTYETSFAMCGATGIILQPHQILRLPRKRNDNIFTTQI